MIDAGTEVFIHLDEELDSMTPCEGPSHPLGIYGHNADEPAAWLLVPDCAHEFLTCDAWLKAADHESGGAEEWYFECPRCGVDTFGDDMVRIPLP